MSSWVTDLEKKINSCEFQPTMDRYWMPLGMIQPRVPNCGTEEAIESTPNRTLVGTVASVTINMPIMLPAVRVANAALKPR
jgi:hypothetical protein